MWFMKKKQVEERGIVAAPAGGFYDILVNPFSAKEPLRIATAYACIRLLANSVSQTPLKDFLYSADGKKAQDSTQLTTLLRNPAPNVTYNSFMSTMLTSMVGHGNAYAYIVRDTYNTPKELLFIPDNRVSIQLMRQISNTHYYTVTLNDDTQLTVYPEDMIHFKNITIDGFTGLSPVYYHSLTIQVGAKATEYMNNFIENSAAISGVIESEARLKPDAIKAIRDSFGGTYGGAAKAGKTAVLGDGLKFKQITPVSPLDVDYINTRKLNDNDIMRIYGVPPPMLGDISSTYANTEQLALIYQRFTLNPMFEAIQQELSLKLIPTRNQSTRKLEFVPNLLKMATARDKAETLAILKREGVMTPNEVREEYGYSKNVGGDEITLPLNIANEKLHKEVLTPKEDTQKQPAQSLSKENSDLRAELGRIKKQIRNSK